MINFGHKQSTVPCWGVVHEWTVAESVIFANIGGRAIVGESLTCADLAEIMNPISHVHSINIYAEHLLAG